MPPTIRCFPSSPSALWLIRQFVIGRSAEVPLPGDATADLVLAVSEVCAELMRATSNAEIAVAWQSAPEAVAIEVRSAGSQVGPPPSPAHWEPPLPLPLLCSLVDEVACRQQPANRGPVVRLVKRRTKVISLRMVAGGW